jgi:hypothetical protein
LAVRQRDSGTDPGARLSRTGLLSQPIPICLQAVARPVRPAAALVALGNPHRLPRHSPSTAVYVLRQQRGNIRVGAPYKDFLFIFHRLIASYALVTETFDCRIPPMIFQGDPRAVQRSIHDAHVEDRTDAAEGDAVAPICYITNAIEAQDVGGE